MKDDLLVWEEIDGYHRRAKVPGGWLVKNFEDVYHLHNESSQGGQGWDWRVSMCFLPDPNHQWGNDEVKLDVPKPPEPANIKFRIDKGCGRHFMKLMTLLGRREK